MWKMLKTKILLSSAAALMAAVGVRLAAPLVSELVFFELPRIYRATAVWLTPPYLYLIINGIIISIAATSRFQKVGTEEADPAVVVAGPLPEPAGPLPEPATPAVEFQIGDDQTEESDRDRGMKKGAGVRDADEEDFVISRSDWTPKSRRGLSEFESLATEKPLVSERFGSRRNVKASPEGRVLGVARHKKSETLENTWKTITDGRAMPLTRHLKKSDTWGNEGRAAGTPPMRKSETFNEQRGATPPAAPNSPARSGGSGRTIRREPSPGQDELNRRVEAFIKKFNEEMRLQRQNSFKDYMEMINRASKQQQAN